MAVVARISICLTFLLLAAAPPTAFADGPTYHGDVAPIFRDHCTCCHRPGGIAPRSLGSYRDVVPLAQAIRNSVAHGTMPPFKAVGSHGEFVGDYRLREQQKRLIEAWVVGGCAEGKRGEGEELAADVPSWQLGPPDVVLHPQPLAGSDPAILAIDLDWPSDGMAASLEIRPRQAGFQHALLWLDLPIRSEVLEVDNQGAAVNRRGLLPVWLRDRFKVPAPGAFRPVERAQAIAARDRRLLGTWSYDRLAQTFGENTGFRFPAGSRLIVETAHASQVSSTEPFDVGIIFAKQRPKRLVATAAVEAVAPKGALSGAFPCQGSFYVPVDCELLRLGPHADSTCREVRVGLTLPSGRSESLLWIDDWEQRWETSYEYRRPLQIPAGSRIDVRFTLAAPTHAVAAAGPLLVSAQLVPIHLGDYDELERAMQRTQMEVARLPAQSSRTLR